MVDRSAATRSSPSATAHPAPRLRVLMLAPMRAGHGIESALDAMALLADVRPRPSFVVASAPDSGVEAQARAVYRETLRRRCWRSGACRLVSFDDVGDDPADRARALEGADLVVVCDPGDDEHGASALLDALAGGTPVVAAAFPRATAALASGAGIVVPAHDPVALAKAVRRVIDEPDLLACMVTECRRVMPSVRREIESETRSTDG